MDAGAVTVSFVIPVRNDAARLQRCLRSIARAAAGRDDVQVIVVDNGSTDDSGAIARAEGAIVLDVDGLRPGALRNRAATVARGEILAFVDADHEIAPGWIAAVVDGLADLSVGAVGAPCHPPVRGTWVQHAYDRLRPHGAPRTTVDWLGSGNLAVRRAAFLAAGGFDTDLETCEDVDLCRRIRALGLTLVSDGRLGNIHYGDPETLGRVFHGELWRGRDNLRVSLRAPRSARTLASAAIPAANLLALAAVPAGLATLTATGAIVATGAVAWMGALVAARAGLMLRRADVRRAPVTDVRRAPWSPTAPEQSGGLGDQSALRTGAQSALRTILQVVAVAAAYEAGRALALVARAGHGRRRGTPGPARGVA